MKKSSVIGVMAALVVGATGAVADEGMWLLNRPPVKALKERHGFEPTAQWLEHMQRSAARPGASGAFVSADGLVMTNHHVGFGAISRLSTPENNLVEKGFYARTRDEELPVTQMEITVLETIEDVTARIDAAAKEGMSAAEANTARRKAMTALEQEREKETGLKHSVVSLYNGARYHLYGYKRYTDVRLVFAPEEQAASFGGDTDNFEYPRFCLDVCFFRVYEEDGSPARPAHYYKWSEEGVSEGDLVFVVGNPGATRRMWTVDHLRYLRDVTVPMTLERLWRREVQLQTFRGRGGDNVRLANDELRSIENNRKRSTGQYAGLLDPGLMRRRIEEEKSLRAKVEGNPEWRAKWGDSWPMIAGVKAKQREWVERDAAVGSVGSGTLFGIAQTIVRLADELPKPSEERLREYRDTALDSVYRRLYSPAPIYDAIEISRVESGLLAAAERLGAEDPLVVMALAGKSPRERAEELVRGTRLKDVAERKRLAEGGAEAVGSTDDPMIALARALDPELRSLRKRNEDEVEAVEREAYAKVAAAQFAVFGEDKYPDATGTLRLSYGTVKGYEEGGQRVPPFTTIGGMFERATARAGESDFVMPESWAKAKGSLDLSTPFNFVCTADIIGGNSGSPVLNRAGEVVGLVFDGNIHSLATDIAYDEKLCRAVSVDARAIIEALRKVYGAGALADEIVGGSAGRSAGR